MTDSNTLVQWEYTIPCSVMVWGAIRLWFLALGICWLLAEIITWFYKSSATVFLLRSIQKGEIGLYFTAGFFGLIIVVSVLVTALIYAGGYAARFRITEDGVVAETMPAQQAKNQRVRLVLTILALTTGKVQALAAAQTSEISERASLSWGKMRKAIPNAKRGTIALRNSWRTVIDLYCTPENYERVWSLIDARLKAKA